MAPWDFRAPLISQLQPPGHNIGFLIYFHREKNSGSFLFDPRKSESMIVVACCPLLIYDELSRPSFVSVLIKEMSLEDDVLSHGQIVAAF